MSTYGSGVDRCNDEHVRWERKAKRVFVVVFGLMYHAVKHSRRDWVRAQNGPHITQ